MQKPIKSITVTECPIPTCNEEVRQQLLEESRSEDGLINPYKVDHYNMGEAFSPTIELMFDKHPTEDRKYAHLFCKVSGKRWIIEIKR